MGSFFVYLGLLGLVSHIRRSPWVIYVFLRIFTYFYVISSLRGLFSVLNLKNALIFLKDSLDSNGLLFRLSWFNWACF